MMKKRVETTFDVEEIVRGVAPTVRRVKKDIEDGSEKNDGGWQDAAVTE
jgi:hypothetical protein